MDYVDRYLSEVGKVVDSLNLSPIRKTLESLIVIRQKGGRVFFLGVGGGAANASHAVNDFRKICGIEAYTPTDNVSELTEAIEEFGLEAIARHFQGG